MHNGHFIPGISNATNFLCFEEGFLFTTTSSLALLQIDLVEVPEGLPCLAGPEVCCYSLKSREVVTAVRKDLKRIHLLTGVRKITPTGNFASFKTGKAAWWIVSYHQSPVFAAWFLTIHTKC